MQAELLEAADSAGELFEATLGVLSHAQEAFELDSDISRVLPMACEQLCAFVAGADGPINANETDFINRMLGVEKSVEFYEFYRANEAPNPEFREAIVVGLKSLIFFNAHLLLREGYAYSASNDPIVQLVDSIGTVVIAADGDICEQESRRLSEIVSELRDRAIDLEAEINSQNSNGDGADEGTVEPVNAGPIVAALQHQEEALVRLHKLIGLSEVKLEVETLANIAKVFAMRKERGLPVPDMSFHLVFAGNPGTGKTTVARIIAEIYGQLGLLSKGHLIEVDRSSLVANYVGQTATKVKEVIARAKGGVLFIDEAYALAPANSDNDFGREAIETLLKEMEDHRDDLVVITAGYTGKMEEFLGSNPGLRSRFSKTIVFPDYSPDEMAAIFAKLAEDAKYVLHEDAAIPLQADLERRWSSRGSDFANARDVRKLFELAIAAQANRLSASNNFSDEDLSVLRLEDLKLAR